MGRKDSEVHGLKDNPDEIRDEQRRPLGGDEGEAVESSHAAIQQCGHVGEGRELLRALTGHDSGEGGAVAIREGRITCQHMWPRV